MTDEELRRVYDAAYTESHAAGLRAVYEAGLHTPVPAPVETTTETPPEGVSGG